MWLLTSGDVASLTRCSVSITRTPSFEAFSTKTNVKFFNSFKISIVNKIF